MSPAFGNNHSEKVNANINGTSTFTFIPVVGKIIIALFQWRLCSNKFCGEPLNPFTSNQGKQFSGISNGLEKH